MGQAQGRAMRGLTLPQGTALAGSETLPAIPCNQVHPGLGAAGVRGQTKGAVTNARRGPPQETGEVGLELLPFKQTIWYKCNFIISEHMEAFMT